MSEEDMNSEAIENQEVDEEQALRGTCAEMDSTESQEG
jgi:hypothetical protein